ncbi:MAG TPA: GNAT family N-acetyltransferase [Caulobacteraceae bacterium]|nr:GNAT family N-acetyltransferase [Caulobacteraceae bacterium]
MAEVRRFQPGDLDGVVALCAAEGWPSFPEDPARALRALTAPGVTTVVADAAGRIVGFAQLLSDGEIQAHLSLIAVHPDARRQGLARQMLRLALTQAGGYRIDLITETAPEFYAALPHRRLEGFRIFPLIDKLPE